MPTSLLPFATSACWEGGTAGTSPSECLLLRATVQEHADNQAADASKVSVRHGEQGVSVPPGSVAAG